MSSHDEPDDAQHAVEELASRRAQIRNAMGGDDKVTALRRSGAMTVRDRIDALLDPGSFREVGTFARSKRPEDRDRTPGDGKAGGHGTVDGRPVSVAGDDITVKRGTSSAVGEFKVERIFDQALNAGNPFVFFGEAGGARIPDVMDAAEFSHLAAMPWFVNRRRRIPAALAIVGESFGASSFMAALADFVVQVRGSCLAVSSPRVIEVATGEKVTMDELGGTEVHSRTTGQIDLAVEDDTEAVSALKSFLSYLPPNAWTQPERVAPAVPVTPQPELVDIVPSRRRRAYDMHHVLDRLADGGTYLELRPYYGRSLITALARIDGHAVGILASQPTYQAGTLGPTACDKATRLLCLCDAFDLPVVLLQDTPGFLVGKQVEHAGLLRHASRLQQALILCGSPRLTVLVRKSFGMAYQVLGGAGLGVDTIYAWPGAEIGFMDPQVGVNVVYAKELEGLEGDARAQRQEELMRLIAQSTSPYDAAGVMAIDEMIDPAETPVVLAQRLGDLAGRRFRPPAERLLASWPTI